MLGNQSNRQNGATPADNNWQDRQNLCGITVADGGGDNGTTAAYRFIIIDYKWIAKDRPCGHIWHNRCYYPIQQISVHKGGGTEEEGIPDFERNFINP